MPVLTKYSHILVLGRGGFGAELGEMLEDCGWGKPVYLDDNAPGCAGALRDYVDPALRRRCPAAFVALGNNALRVRAPLALRNYQEDIRDLLERVVPSALWIDFDLERNSHRKLANFTHACLAQYTHEDLENEVIQFA